MSNSDLTTIIIVLLLLVGFAQLLGYLFIKLRQPKVIGEILAGIVLGPALLGRFPIISHLVETATHQGNILDFVYWLGLLLLMFLSGAETQELFTPEERREVGWLAIVGTGIPFVLGLALCPWLIRPALAGANGNRMSLVIILAVGVAVTSVPVVSKIFADLKIPTLDLPVSCWVLQCWKTSSCGWCWLSRQPWLARQCSMPERCPII